MKRLYTTIAQHLRQGESAMLATVLRVSGSTPRDAGTQMLLLPDGSTSGTVGGGEMEFSVIQLGLALLGEGRSAVRSFHTLGARQPDGPGAICGGEVTVGLWYLPGGDVRFATLFSDAAALCGDGGGWLALRLQSGAGGLGVEPALTDGQAVSFSKSVTLAELRPFLWNQPVYQPGEPAWFCMPLPRERKTYLFGAGHVARKLGALLGVLETPFAVIDDRPELCCKTAFPAAARCIVDQPSAALAGLSIGPEDEIVTMTRSHMTDYAVLEQALRTGAAYIGCIGSREKIAMIRRRLGEAGFSQDDIARIHAPIGLPIGAQTPAEIAVSIAAELIQSRRKA